MTTEILTDMYIYEVLLTIMYKMKISRATHTSTSKIKFWNAYEILKH